MSEQINRKTWEEFRESGMLWWVNRMLHLLGWAIVVLESEQLPRHKCAGLLVEVAKEIYANES